MRTLPSRVARSTSGKTLRTRPSTRRPASSVDLRGRALADPHELGLGDLAFELDLAVGDDPEQRIAGGGRDRADARRLAADDAAACGALISVRARRTSNSRRWASAERRSACAMRERVAGGREPPLGRARRGDALLEHGLGGVAALHSARARSSACAASSLGRLGLDDGGFSPARSRLRRARSRPRSARAAPRGGRASVGRAPRPGCDDVALLDEHLGDAQAVDLGRDEDLLARHQGAGDDGALDDLALGRADHRDGGRERRRRGAGSAATAGDARRRESERQGASASKRAAHHAAVSRGRPTSAQGGRSSRPAKAASMTPSQPNSRSASKSRDRAADEQPVREGRDHGRERIEIDLGRDRPFSCAGRNRTAIRSMTSRSNSSRCAAKAGLRVASAQISRHRTARSRGSSSKCLRPSAPKPLEKSSAPIEAREILHDPCPVPLRETGHHRVLGGKVAVEVARAHARLGGDVLHGGAVKAGAHEAALGRIEDARTAVGRTGPGAGHGRRGLKAYPWSL